MEAGLCYKAVQASLIQAQPVQSPREAPQAEARTGTELTWMLGRAILRTFWQVLLRVLFSTRTIPSDTLLRWDSVSIAL